jgi:uncharacterized protein (DUF2225 family)
MTIICYNCIHIYLKNDIFIKKKTFANTVGIKRHMSMAVTNVDYRNLKTLTQMRHGFPLSLKIYIIFSPNVIILKDAVKKC